MEIEIWPQQWYKQGLAREETLHLILKEIFVIDL